MAETHGDKRPGSTGLTIYFPNSAEYDYTFSGESALNYPSSVGRFATASLWDDYLTYHYTGATFDAGLADLAVLTPAKASQTDFTEAVEESAPAADAQIVGPAQGSSPSLPSPSRRARSAQDGTVTLTTKINGSNIAYVYYYVSYYWEDDGSYLTADEGFVEPGSTKEIGGVFYPDWGDEGVIDVNYDWEPTVYYMSDGNEANDQFAFFEPTVYGADTSTDIYTVRGTYTFLDSGTQIDAEMDFNGDGDMQGVWGFTDVERRHGHLARDHPAARRHLHHHRGVPGVRPEPRRRVRRLRRRHHDLRRHALHHGALLRLPRATTPWASASRTSTATSVGSSSTSRSPSNRTSGGWTVDVLHTFEHNGLALTVTALPRRPRRARIRADAGARRRRLRHR